MLRRGARGSQERERRDGGGGVRVLVAAASIHRDVGHGLARPVAGARSGSRRGPEYEFSPTQRDACGPGQDLDRIGPPFGTAPDVAYRPAEGWTRKAPAAKGASGRHYHAPDLAPNAGAPRRRTALSRNGHYGTETAALVESETVSRAWGEFNVISSSGRERYYLALGTG